GRPGGHQDYRREHPARQVGRRGPDLCGDARDRCRGASSHRRLRRTQEATLSSPMLIVGTRTLKSALEDKVERCPDKLFLLFEDSAGNTAGWTWREFDRAVNRTSHLLLRHGLRHGDTFNLHLGNCPEFLFFWMAAAKTGTVMVPTNPASTAD